MLYTRKVRNSFHCSHHEGMGEGLLALVINLNVCAAYLRRKVPFSFEGQANWAPDPMWSLLDNIF